MALNVINCDWFMPRGSQASNAGKIQENVFEDCGNQVTDCVFRVFKNSLTAF